MLRKEAHGTRIEKGRQYELLGFDFLLDNNLHPWLLEINHTPSMRLDNKGGDEEVILPCLHECDS